MAETITLAREPAGDAVADLKRENAQLKAYLRAFVRATYSHPRDCYGGQTPAQDATSMHRVNPGMTYSFGLNELEGDDPVITGGQVMRAMELLGEAPELTPAEEAKNLKAAAVLRDVQNTIAMAVEAIAGRQGEPSTPEMLKRLAAAGSPAEARARYLAGALVHLRNMAEGIPAVLKRTPSEQGEPIAPYPPDRGNLRKALAEITRAADALILTLPGHWHDDATIELTDAAAEAHTVLRAAEQNDLYEAPAALAQGEA